MMSCVGDTSVWCILPIHFLHVLYIYTMYFSVHAESLQFLVS